MHILPVYFTTTNTRKRKKSKKPASLIEAEHQHAKFIEKMKVKRSVAQSGSASALGAGGQRFESSHLDKKLESLFYRGFFVLVYLYNMV